MPGIHSDFYFLVDQMRSQCLQQNQLCRICAISKEGNEEDDDTDIDKGKDIKTTVIIFSSTQS